MTPRDLSALAGDRESLLVEQGSLTNGREQRGIRTSLRVALPPLAAGIALLTFWELTTMWVDVPAYVLPRPGDVLQAFKDNGPVVVSGLRITAAEAGLGLLIGGLTGTTLAVVMAARKSIRSALYPFVIALAGSPKAAFGPLIVVWVGLGFFSKVALAALFAFVPFVVQMTRGFVAIPDQAADYIVTLRPTQWRLWAHVRLPAALPHLVDALRLAFPAAVIGAIVAEFIASTGGVGYVIISASGRLDMALAFAGVISAAALATSIYPVTRVLENHAPGWSR